jgi:hypothetical protein
MPHRPTPARAARATALCLLALLCPLGAGGCAVAGLAAHAMPRFTEAAYGGLAGQTVAVMVDVDDAILIDWPDLRLDVAAGVQDKLAQAQMAGSKELEKTQFPFPPASVVRFQREHPEIHAQPLTRIAPRLGGITRLIYVEMEDFQTHPAGSLDLFRGSASARIRVVEVADGRAKVAYEDVLKALFPVRAPEEGIPGADEYAIYRGTVNEFTSQIAKRFITHESEH